MQAGNRESELLRAGIQSEWRRASSCSAECDNCVEVRYLTADAVAVRNSRAIQGGLITVDRMEWDIFIRALRDNALS